MSAERTCSQCGAPLPANAPGSRCPKCLLQLALEESGDAGVPQKTATFPEINVVIEQTGMMIGRYKLLQQIGEGGFGIVFMAEQTEPVQRKVALKVIKAGMDTREVIARFEAERQALALMDHPNIAQVLDGGTTPGGRPYFVMELVRGVPITDYCDHANLSTRERLELFIKVCRAVQHAHQKGVIHRDLKPSNVLVTLHDGEPVPKVIDFGVAKALGQKLTDKTLFTRFEQMIGTPAYMSPEQAALSGLDIDTRSDIYSLGVLLYELLTGVTPLDAETLRAAALDEVRRMIQETEPLRPSTRVATLGERLADVAKCRHAEPASLTRLIRGDLDWITMKALEKDRRRRYETVNGLAADVERHLNHEPVVARPASAAYRFQRTVQRHRVAFVAGTVILIALVLGAVISTWQAVRATRAEVEQSKQRQLAEKAQANETTQRQRAEDNAVESRTRLVRQYVANGNRLVDEGDLFAALPWFAKALKEEQDPTRVEIHRLRLGTTLQQCPKLVQTWFHEGRMRSVAFSPDGQWVLTASDRVARVWDTGTGEAVSPPLEYSGQFTFATFSPDGQRVTAGRSLWDVRTGRSLFPFLRGSAVIFSPDGRRIATGGTYDPPGQLWDAATGEKLGRPLPEKHEPRAFSPDGSRIVIRGEATVIICDTTTGEPVTPELVYPPPGHNPELDPDRPAQRDCEFSPDSSRLAVACGDNTARVCDASTGKEIILVRHRRDVRRASFSPDGRRLLTASDDGTAQMWDAATGVRVSPLLKHAAPVLDASFSRDGRYVVTGSSDGTARVWNAATSRPMTPPIRHAAPVTRASFGPDADLIVTGSDDHTARVWDWKASGTAPGRVKHPTVVQEVAFSSDSRTVATVGVDGTAKVWDLITGNPLPSLLSNLVAIRCAHFSPDGRLLAVANSNGLVRVWNLASGLPVSPPLIHSGLVNHLEFSADGKRLLTAGSDRVVRLWEPVSGTVVNEMKHTESVNYARFTTDGKQVVTVSVSAPILFRVEMYERWSFNPVEREAITANWGQAQLWNVETGEPVTPPRKLGAAVSVVGISPDGRRAAPACASRALTQKEVWAVDLLTGRRLAQPFRHERGVIHVSFSQDAKRVVTASWDNTARVWDASTAEPVGPPLRHEKSVRYAEFSPNSRLVATASEDQTARVWDAATGGPVTPPLRHRDVVESALFNPDGRRLLTTSADGLVSVWELPRTSRAVEDEVRLAQFLAGHWIDDTDALLPVSPQTMQGAWLMWRAEKARDGGSAAQSILVRPESVAKEEDEGRSADMEVERAVLDSQYRDRVGSCYRKLFRASFATSNQWAELIELCSQALSFEPRGGGPYLQRGVAYEQTGQFQKAIRDIREYLWIKGPPLKEGDDNYWYVRRGTCYRQLGETEKSEADFQTAAAEMSPESYNYLAWQYVTGPTNFQSPEMALPLALKAVELSKTNSYNELNTLGVVYYRLGQLTNAIRILETGIRADSAGGSAHDFFFLAMAHHRLGDPVQGEAFYTKAEKWMADQPSHSPEWNAELESFRAEAEEVLGKPKAK